MTSMIIWMLGMGVSVAALVITAAMELYYVHMAVAALVSILVALTSFAESRRVEATGNGNGNGSAVGTQLRHMGLIWCWGALSLLIIYGTGILSWREWWQFFIGFFLLAGLSLFLSATVNKDADAGSTDDAMLSIARGFSIFILVAMLITMAGLLIDGKMWRFTTAAGLRRGSQDWAANNVFFFGAMALAAIGWNAVRLLRSQTKPQPTSV